MAPSFSNAKLILSIALTSRRYTSVAASQGAVSSTIRGGASAMSNVMLKKVDEEERNKTSSWVPDPKTGYYRPENHAEEDAAELREMLLMREMLLRNKARRN